MLTSTQNGHLFRIYGAKESIRMLSEAGFDAYDMSLYALPAMPDDPLNGPDYLEVAAELRAYADGLGIPCNQCHAIFPPVKGDEDDPARYETLIRHLEIASVLGAKIVVVHPAQHLYYHKNAEALKEINMEFYRSLLPYCEKLKIKIAVENMWRRYYDKSGNRITHSVCSRPAEFCDYVDTLDSPWIVACLDIGHVSLVGEDMTEMIHSLGHRLQSLHVHDTDTQQDLHTLPFQSRIDFEEVTQALADIGYEGDITLEADAFYGTIPAARKELHQAAATYMCAVARTIRSMVQEKKK